jgi:hypothetical protein
MRPFELTFIRKSRKGSIPSLSANDVFRLASDENQDETCIINLDLFYTMSELRIVKLTDFREEGMKASDKDNVSTKIARLTMSNDDVYYIREDQYNRLKDLFTYIAGLS